MTNAWVFNGAPYKRFPGGVFTNKALAEQWIKRHRLTGVLTLYPVDVGAYDWALESGLFSPRKPHESEPEFIGGFSGGMEHYHYEDGDRC